MTSAVPLSPPLEVAVVVAGALWMTLAPQVPAALRRRGLLAALTWAGSRLLLAWLAHTHLSALALRLVADFVAWRALADAGGEDGEAAWAWAATPAVALFVLRAGPAATIGAPAAALALAFVRRGWSLPAGFALAIAVGMGGPWLAGLALPFALASARRPVRLAAILVPVAGALLVWWGHANDTAWPVHLDLPPAGSGPTLWRVPTALGLAVSPVIAWASVAVLGVFGAVRLLLARATATVETFGAWGFALLAALVPGTSAAHLLPWLPLVCLWLADDPDRRGWWVTEGLVLPLAMLLEAYALGGGAGPLWRGFALAGIPVAALLALWPLRAMRFGNDPAPHAPGAHSH